MLLQTIVFLKKLLRLKEKARPNSKLRKSGIIPDIEDERDYKLEVGTSSFAPEIDLRPYVKEIKQQGRWNSCFLKGTPILMTDFIHRPIEDLKEGELIFDDSLKPRQILKTMKRDYDGQLYKFKLYKNYNEFKCTSEHPIKILRENSIQFIPANQIKITDKFLVPITKEHSSEKIKVMNLIEDQLTIIDNKVRCYGQPIEQAIDMEYELTPDLMKLFGLFLAEGNYLKHPSGIKGIQFTFNIKETEYADFVVKTINDLFVGYINKKEEIKGHRLVVQVYNSIVGKLFYSLCGEYSNRKELNSILLNTSKELSLNLIRGWMMGDGHLKTKDFLVRKNGEHSPRRQAEATTISKKLAYQMYFLSLRCGLFPSMRMDDRCYEGRQISYKLFFYGLNAITLFPRAFPKMINYYKQNKYAKEEGYFSVKIEEIDTEYFKGEVYNLEVENNPSYIVDLYPVHNCVSHAICSCVEIQLNIQKPQTFMPLSERYNYYYGRLACGFSTSKNVGMYPRNAIKSAFEVGIAPEITCAYSENKSSEPTQMAKIMAHLYKQRLGKYRRITSQDGMKTCLNDLKPFFIACPTYSFWTNGGVGKDGIIRNPTDSDKFTGYHAMTCVGYNNKGWIVLNSWNNWGEYGYGYLPYDYSISDRWLIELN